jgi:L-xylulose reductase
MCPALDVSKDILQRTFETNLFASIYITQIVAKKIIAAKRNGSIVNISSLYSLQSAPNYLAYTSSKAALDMVTKQFALELGPYNIRVNAINPTIVKTEAMQSLFKEVYPLDKLFIDKTPLGRIAEIKEVVYPILYLLSDLSSMVSGTTHIVDGGAISSFVTKL